jgi:ribokinase
MKAHPKIIVVVGSLNVDHTFRVTHFPAASRAGGNVLLIGCVGDDELGGGYLKYLQGEGILTEAIIRSPPLVWTGTAFIVVDDQGENLIVVNPGANHALHPQHIDAHAALIRTAGALLLQLECPLATVMRAAEIAREAGVPVILNPSPLTPEFLHSGMKVHTLIVNEHEEQEASAWIASNGHTPLAARCEQLIITAGPKPTRAVTPTQSISLHPPHVTPADTTGAGDTFAGAFAVALTEGQPLAEALAFANAAGALATLLPGAQTAIPWREEIMEFMKSQEGDTGSV